MNKLNSYEKGFISAFIDTDGSICLDNVNTRKTPRIAVYFNNNSIELLERVRDMIGIEKSFKLKKGSRNYALVYYRAQAVELLKQVKLIVKEHRREVAIELGDYIASLGGRSINQYSKPPDYDDKIRLMVESFYKS